MRKIYFTPGPSQLFPTVIDHFNKAFEENIASTSHRSKQFQEMYQNITDDLKKLLQIPKDYQIFIVGSGTEAIERTIQNCVEKYSFHFVNGSFSKRFFTMSEELGKKPEKYEVAFGEGFTVSDNVHSKKNVSKNLIDQIVPKRTELICFTHNESSTGVMTPFVQIENIAKKFPDTLIAVDIVSSVPYADLKYKMLDVVFFSVQKGFGLPAGLGVIIVSPRAIKKAKKILQKKKSIGSYHAFPTMFEFANKNLTYETPPVLEMYIFGKVIADMLTIGIDNIRLETEKKASVLYDFLDTNKSFSPYVLVPQFRSQTIIVVDITKTKTDIKKVLSEKGIIVGSGYGKQKDTHIRIANFPTHSIESIQRLIKQLKAF